MNKPSLPSRSAAWVVVLKPCLGLRVDLLSHQQLPRSSYLAKYCSTLQTTQLQPSKYQPRREMSEAKLAELADSIKAQG